MEQLSSCYFCGGALDVSLAEYPIVPKALQPDAEAQGTVVLCSTCRQKLAAIVEPVVEATESSAADADRERTPLDGRESDPTTGDESESPSGDGIVDPAADGTLLGGNASGESTRTATDSPTETVGEPSDDSASGVALDRGETDVRSGTDAAADTAEAAPADTPERSDTGTSDETADETASGDSDTTEQGPSLTKLEYNKVMRLLQNREMPVDRAEIREVAVNAYDIESEQFDAIIDAAVERDLIGQERGKLVESE